MPLFVQNKRKHSSSLSEKTNRFKTSVSKISEWWFCRLKELRCSYSAVVAAVAWMWSIVEFKMRFTLKPLKLPKHLKYQQLSLLKTLKKSINNKISPSKVVLRWSPECNKVQTLFQRSWRLFVLADASASFNSGNGLAQLWVRKPN